jgi:hypothetical protein
MLSGGYSIAQRENPSCHSLQFHASSAQGLTSRSGIGEWPVDTLVFRAGVVQACATIQTDWVVGRRSHILKIDTLFYFGYQLWSTHSRMRLVRYLRGLEAPRAIRPSAIMFHCWDTALSEQLFR